MNNAQVIVVRTYANYTIKFESSEWSGYETYEEAAKVLAGCTRPGTVVENRFTAEFVKDSPLHQFAIKNGREPIAEHEILRVPTPTI